MDISPGVGRSWNSVGETVASLLELTIPSPITILSPLLTARSLSFPQRQEEQQRHRPSPWRVLYNLIMGLLPLPRGHRAPEMEPN